MHMKPNVTVINPWPRSPTMTTGPGETLGITEDLSRDFDLRLKMGRRDEDIPRAGSSSPAR